MTDLIRLASDLQYFPGYVRVQYNISSNIYVLEHGNEVVLIDSGNATQAKNLLPLLEGKKIKEILLTHGHFDHVDGVPVFNAPAYASEFDATHLRDLNPFFSSYSPPKVSVMNFSEHLFGDFHLRVIPTPGHTHGSVSFFDQARGLLFSGDTLFARGVHGRTDLFSSNAQEMQESLEKLGELNYRLLMPGHGEVEEKN